ncbi:MAG: bacterial Ig-like domain-containing protein, partial [Anaeroplasmataceae bacterium]|nr:bacterial Ig-like domain-containing protein [Anaeroplasmataceae bacterium]
MKKIWILLFISFLFVLAGCKTNQEDKDTILSIELKNIENIDVYQGDDYSPRNVIVYAVYEKKKIEVTEDAKFSKISTEDLGYQTVTVTYLQFSANYSVRVVARPHEPSLSLLIKALPEKKEYYAGEELSITGIHVVIVENEEEVG